MTRAQTEAIAELAVVLASKGSHPVQPSRAAAIALDMHRIAMQAHRWFERNCNEDLSEKRYFARLGRLTERMNQAVLGCLEPNRDPKRSVDVRFGTWEWQTDPRGWPLIVHVDGREYRVGGR